MNRKKILSSLALTVAISSGLIGVLNLDSSVYAGTKYDLSVSEESKDTYAEKFTDDDTTGIKVYFGSSNTFDMNKLKDSMKKILEIDSPEDFEGNLMIVAQLSSSELNNEFRKLMEDMNLAMIGRIQNTYRWKPKGEVNLQPIFDKEENVSNEENNTSTVKASEEENNDIEEDFDEVGHKIYKIKSDKNRYMELKYYEEDKTLESRWIGDSVLDIPKLKKIIKSVLKANSPKDYTGNFTIIFSRQVIEQTDGCRELLEAMNMKVAGLQNYFFIYKTDNLNLEPIFDVEESIKPSIITPVPSVETVKQSFYKRDNKPKDYKTLFKDSSNIKEITAIEDFDISTVGADKEAKLKVVFKDGSSKIVKIPYEVKDKIEASIITPVPKIEENFQRFYKGDSKPEDYKTIFEDSSQIKEVIALEDFDTSTIVTEKEAKVKVVFKDGSSRIVKVPYAVKQNLNDVSKWYKDEFIPFIEKTFDIVEKTDESIKYKLKGDITNNIYEIKNYEKEIEEQKKKIANKEKIKDIELVSTKKIEIDFLYNSPYEESLFALENIRLWEDLKAQNLPTNIIKGRENEVNTGDIDKLIKTLERNKTTPHIKYPYISSRYYNKNYGIVARKTGTIGVALKDTIGEKEVLSKTNDIMNYYFLSSYKNLKDFVSDFYNYNDLSNLSTKGNEVYSNLIVDKESNGVDTTGSSIFDIENLASTISFDAKSVVAPEKLFKFTEERLAYLKTQFKNDKNYAFQFLVSKKEALGDELYNRLLKQIKEAKNSIELSNILTREIYRYFVNKAFENIDFTDVNIRNSYIETDNLDIGKDIDKFDKINFLSTYGNYGMNEFFIGKREANNNRKKLSYWLDYRGQDDREERTASFLENFFQYHKDIDKEDFEKYLRKNLEGYDVHDFIGGNLFYQIATRYWYNLNVGNKISEIASFDNGEKYNSLDDRLENIESLANSTRENIKSLINIANEKENKDIYLKEIENRIKKIEELDKKDTLTKEQKATWADILFKETDYNSISSEINDFIKAVEFIKKQGGENEDNKITLLNNTYFKNRKQKKSLDYAINNDVALEENTDEDTSNVSKPRRKVLNDSLTPEGEAPKEDKGIQTETEKPLTTEVEVQTEKEKAETASTETQTDNKSTIDKGIQAEVVKPTTEAELQTEKEKTETVSSETQTDNKATTDKGIQSEIAKPTTEAEVQTENSKAETVSSETQTDNKATTEEQPKVTADKGIQTEERLEKEDVKESKDKTQKVENKKDSRKTESSKENISNARDEKVSLTKDKAVKTGDDSNIILSMFSTVLAFVTGAYIKRKKNNR